MIRKTLVLVGGQGMAQALSIAVLPLLSRLYSTREFGNFALFSAMCWLSAVIATFQLEHLVILPRSNRSASSIVCLSLLLGATVASFVTISTAVLHAYGYFFYDVPHGVFLSATAFFTVAGISTTQGLRAWLVRNGEFSLISRGTALMTVSSCFTSIVLPVLVPEFKSIGLMLGQSVGLSCCALLWSVSCRLPPVASASLSRLRVTLRRYKRLASQLTAANLFKTAGGRVPTWIMSSVEGPSAAGQFAMAERLCSVPTTLFATSIGSSFRHHVGTIARGRPSKIAGQALLISGSSLIILLPSFCLLGFACPLLFRVALGESWAYAGEMAAVLLLREALVFTQVSVEDAFIVLGQTRYRLCWQVLYFTFIVGIYVGTSIGLVHNAITVLWLFFLGRGLFSLADIYIITRRLVPKTKVEEKNVPKTEAVACVESSVR